MGCWGPKLFQDDVTQDVRDTYKDKLRKGKDGQEATKELLEEYVGELNDADDKILIWLALADTQWRTGRLEEFVKTKALKLLDQGADLERWRAENPKGAIEREKDLQLLKERLLSPQPPQKKFSQPRIFTCTWQIGDVFAYPLESDGAKAAGLQGRYLILYKIGNHIMEDGNIYPVVLAAVTQSKALPVTKNDLEKLKWLRTFMAEDDYGRKGFNYRFFIRTTSKRAIPKTLQYIGNYGDLPLPGDEIVYEELMWGCIYKFLEELMISKVQWNRELS